MRFRTEKDTRGQVQVPLQAYFGIGAQRSKDLFQITKHGLNRQMIRSFAAIKKSAAKTNHELGFMDNTLQNVISLACDEIQNGRLHGQFVIDIVQGGSGIAMNYNANEVIANRANELLGGEKGVYDLVDPNKDVNMHQDDLQVVLLACKLSAFRLTKKLLTEAKKLSASVKDYSEKNANRPELVNFKLNLEKDLKKVTAAMNNLQVLSDNVSTFPNNDLKFLESFVENLNKFVSIKMKVTKDPIVDSINLDDIAHLSFALRTLMSNLAKETNDLALHAKQKGIELNEDAKMTIEVVKQISFYVMGNDLTIQRATEAGEQDNNIFIPIIFACLFEMINFIRRIARISREQIIDLM